MQYEHEWKDMYLDAREMNSILSHHIVRAQNEAERLEDEVQMLHRMINHFRENLGVEKFEELRDSFFDTQGTNFGDCSCCG